MRESQCHLNWMTSCVAFFLLFYGTINIFGFVTGENTSGSNTTRTDFLDAIAISFTISRKKDQFVNHFLHVCKIKD